jgi:peptide/nickel transport system ATP-binding protein
MNEIVLQVRHLKTCFYTPRGIVRAVDDVSFTLRSGECLCLVGESGCGKTATALSILRLIESPSGQIVNGEVFYGGEDLLQISNKRLRQIRGNNIAMIFQDPQSALNPVLTVGDQATEQVKLHLKLKEKEAATRLIALMERAGIPRADDRMKDYPHQFSGGMKQRVMIAAALSCGPDILIADEPTTALDATIKAQILGIFREMKQNRRMATLFITHDLGTVAEIADRIVVMYGGRVVESGSALDIFDHPKHPYTLGLIDCLPRLTMRMERLKTIPGTIPDLIDPPTGCIFRPRCGRSSAICELKRPPEAAVSGEHTVACHLFGQDI